MPAMSDATATADLVSYLLAFALGALIALSPLCLPQLPQWLGASLRPRRSLPAFVVGLIGTLFALGAGLGQLAEALHLPARAGAGVGMAALVLLMLALAVPALGARLNAATAAWARGANALADDATPGRSNGPLTLGAGLALLLAPGIAPLLGDALQLGPCACVVQHAATHFALYGAGLAAVLLPVARSLHRAASNDETDSRLATLIRRSAAARLEWVLLFAALAVAAVLRGDLF